MVWPPSIRVANPQPVKSAADRSGAIPPPPRLPLSWPRSSFAAQTLAARGVLGTDCCRLRARQSSRSLNIVPSLRLTVAAPMRVSSGGGASPSLSRPRPPRIGCFSCLSASKLGSHPADTTIVEVRPTSSAGTLEPSYRFVGLPPTSSGYATPVARNRASGSSHEKLSSVR